MDDGANTNINAPLETHRTSNTNRQSSSSSPFSSSPPPPPPPPISIATSITTASTFSTGSTITGITHKHGGRKLPGLLIYIEQGKWERVAERARKYPVECEKWITMKRKITHSSHSNNDAHGSSTPKQSQPQPQPQPNHLSSPNHSLQSKSLCSAKSFASNTDTSHVTIDTNYTTTSAITTTTSVTNATAATIHSKGYTHVKCKALHHACLKLNSVHSQIRDLIQSELNEYSNSHWNVNVTLPSPTGINHNTRDVNHATTSTSASATASPNAKSPTHNNNHTNATASPESSSSPSSQPKERLCSPSCHLAAASSFDEFGDTPSIAEQISPTLGKVMNCISMALPSTSNNGDQYSYKYMDGNNNGNGINNASNQWDDPWIEACKAILTILEKYPEAAKERETRHGCLPLHLAVFAMRPTPTAILPDHYVKFKYSGGGNSGGSSFSSFFPSSLRASASCLTGAGHGANIGSGAGAGHGTGASHHQSHKAQINAASNLQNDGNNNHNIQPSSSSSGVLPPRPLQLLRGKSNSSAGSFASGRSLSGFSTVLMEGGGCSLGATSTISDKVSQELTDSMLSLEEKLRLNQTGGHCHSDNHPRIEKGGLTEEEVTLLEKCARPNPMSSNLDRNSSLGSTYSNCSRNSTVSNCSTLMPLEPTLPKPRQKEFYLDRYIANAKRREEFSLKVIDALLSVYKKASSTDSEGGRLPLHMAVSGRATLKVIDTVVRSYPYAARYRTKDGSLPLHLAAHSGVSDEEVAPTLLRHYPYATVGKNRFERTPLEEGLLQAGENGREHQIELMVALRRPAFYWKSARQSDIINSPIGSVGKGRSRDEETMVCVDDYVEGNTDNDVISLTKRQEWETILKKIEFFSPIIKNPLHTTVRGVYMAKVSVLHLACEQNPTYEVLDALVSVCPAALTWRKLPGGSLPLHLAATWKASASVIGFLLAANPQAAKQRDALWNLPLHCACYSGASEDIIESLLCTNPLTINSKNAKGDKPRDIVKRLSHKNKKAVISLIDRVSLELRQKKMQSVDYSKVNGRSKNSKGRKKLELPSEKDKMNWI